jgi:hypothetical protein
LDMSYGHTHKLKFIVLNVPKASEQTFSLGPKTDLTFRYYFRERRTWSDVISYSRMSRGRATKEAELRETDQNVALLRRAQPRVRMGWYADKFNVAVW